MPRISVIMPAYNAEKYIAEAIDSILGQTFGDFEFIIINDCSQDGTEEIIRSYRDSRIVYLKNEENLGVAATLNRGLALARGEYIARMDADDISLPDRFRLQVEYLDAHREVAVLGTAVEVFGERNQIIGFSQSDSKLRVDLLFGSCFAHPSVIIRATVIHSLGGYDSEYEGMEDYDLWCRVAEKHEFAALPQVLLRYRVHSKQVTQNIIGVEKQRRYCRLQERIMGQLGVETDNVGFRAWCNISKGDADTLVECMAFFRQIIQINRHLQIYDERYLSTSVEAAVLRYVDKMPLNQAISVANRCGIKPIKYVIRRLRRYIKK